MFAKKKQMSQGARACFRISILIPSERFIPIWGENEANLPHPLYFLGQGAYLDTLETFLGIFSTRGQPMVPFY